MKKKLKQLNKKKSIKTLEAGTIISESFTNTKTIFAYNFQTKARDLYLRANDYILRQQVINEFINGLIIGLTLFANFAKNAALFAATKRYVLNIAAFTTQFAKRYGEIGENWKTDFKIPSFPYHIDESAKWVFKNYSSTSSKFDRIFIDSFSSNEFDIIYLIDGTVSMGSYLDINA